jgi:hypothetical protein
MKLNVTAFGLAAGCLAALGMMLYTVLAYSTGYGIELETIFESLNPGYTLSIAGAIVGALWEFAIAFLCASLFALIYNALAGPKK